MFVNQGLLMAPGEAVIIYPNAFVHSFWWNIWCGDTNKICLV